MGFVPAFFSNFVDALVRGQHDRWRLIGMRLDSQRTAAKAGLDADADAATRQGLRTGRVLIELGKTDRALFLDELEPDAKAVLGDAKAVIKVFDAGQEVPITYAEVIVEFVWQKWEAAR